MTKTSPTHPNLKKIIFTTLGLILIISVFYFSLTYLDTPGYAQMPELGDNDRILVIAPHPDDESLAAGGLIKKARDRNATVKVVMMTDGSSAATPQEFSQYLENNDKNSSTGIGELRREEALQAMSKLGVNESSIIFLGYPDTGLKTLFEDNWDSDKPYQSNTAFNMFDHSPYNFTYRPNVTYSGANVAGDLKEIKLILNPP